MRLNNYSIINNLYLIMLTATPIVEVLAGATLLVTYILYCYRLLLLLIAMLWVRGASGFWRPLRRHLILPTAYVLLFWVATFYGADLEYSIRYRALLLPVLLVDFFLWYVAGRLLDEKLFVKRIYLMTLLFAMLSILWAAIGWINVEQTRVFFGPDVPIGLAAAAICARWQIVLVLAIATLASVKKAVVLCGAVGLITVAGLKGIYSVPGWGRDRIAPGKLVLSGILLFAVLAFFVDLSWPLIEETISRLALEREDLYRQAMFEEFLRLLKEYFPYGSGYYTFGSLTRETLPYTTYMADGTPLNDGMSLHNTGMHVLLEGGLAVSIVLLMMYFKVFRCLFQLIRNPASRGVGIVSVAWIFVCLVYGMVHQLHATRYYFGIIGYVIGCHWRYFPRVGHVVPVKGQNVGGFR